MIPQEIWRAQVDPAPHRVLLYLWSFGPNDATGVKEDGGAFVWPSIGRLCDGLGITESTAYRSLAILTDAGWIRRSTRIVADKGRKRRSRKGWWLVLTPGASEGSDPDDSEGSETDLRRLGGPTSEGSDPHLLQEEPVEEPRNSRARATAPKSAPELRTPKGGDGGSSKSNEKAEALFRRYELARVSQLGSPPARVPMSRDLARMHSLLSYIRRRFELSLDGAWAMLEKYAAESLRLAMEARKADHRLAPALVAARSDGSEWSTDRFDAVMARLQDAPATEHWKRAPVLVDDEPLTEDETKLWLDVANRDGAVAAYDAVQEKRASSRPAKTDALDDWSGVELADKAAAFLAAHGIIATSRSNIAGCNGENT